MKKYIKIARPDHWTKNMFIIPGMVVALLLAGENEAFGAEIMPKLVLGFLATCFIASANYVINEWLDAEFDKYHPTKKYRPVVEENVKGSVVLLEYLSLIALGMGLSFTVSCYFAMMEAILLLMGVLYNVKPFRTKDLPYLDVLSESVNNAIRLMLGWFVVTNRYLPPASIVIGYWMAGAYLMAVKRYAEYRMIGDPALAGKYRKSFLYYTENSLLVSAFFYAICSVFMLGTFMIKYRIELLLAFPVLCGLFCMYLAISFKEDSAVQKPEKLFRERKLMVYLAFLVVLMLVLLKVDIPILADLLDNTLIAIR